MRATVGGAGRGPRAAATVRPVLASTRTAPWPRSRAAAGHARSVPLAQPPLQEPARMRDLVGGHRVRQPGLHVHLDVGA